MHAQEACAFQDFIKMVLLGEKGITFQATSAIWLAILLTLLFPYAYNRMLQTQMMKISYGMLQMVCLIRLLYGYVWQQGSSFAS